MMILLGSHYLPVAFLYGMRMFAALAALLVGGGLVIATYWSRSYSEGAWYTGATLLVFAGLQPLKLVVRLEKGKLHTALLLYVDSGMLRDPSTIGLHPYAKPYPAEKSEWSHCRDGDLPFCPLKIECILTPPDPR
jgi:hypothetical protein